MQQYLTVPVKIYSAYSELQYAPLAFEGPPRPLEPKKWLHIPSDGSLMLSILKSDNGKIIMRILKNENVLEFIEVELVNNHNCIRFSVRVPSISCKYLVHQPPGSYIKRFQLVLFSEEDHLKTCLAFTNFGFAVKNARPSALQKYVGCHPYAIFNSNEVVRKGFGNQNPTQVYSQQFSFDCSQSSSQKIWQYYQPSPRSENMPSPLESPKIPMPPARSLHEVPAAKHTDLGVSLVAEPITMTDKKAGQKTLNEETLDSLPGKCLPDEKARFRPPVAILTQLNTEIQLPKLPKILPQPLREKVTQKETQDTLAAEEKENLNELSSKSRQSCSKSSFKITKKLIKQKLKDENFLKWVNKVESAMEEINKTVN